MASALSLFARPRLSPGYLTRLARGRRSTFAQRKGSPSLTERRSLATSVHMQPVSARNPAAVISFDHAIEAYVRQRGDSHGALSDALTVEPGLVPALALRVALQVFDSTSSVDDATVALQRAVDAPIASATPRERAIATACCALAAGRLRLSAAILEGVLLRPEAGAATDALVLRLLHDIYNALGDSVAMRGSVARVFQSWDPSMPLYSSVVSMLSWALTQTGALASAEELGMTALNMDPQDGWALRSCVEACALGGRAPEGLRLLRETHDGWAGATWHEHRLQWKWALMQLEEGDLRGAMARYDSLLEPWRLQPASHDIDDVSLLWRVTLAEHPAVAESQFQPLRTLAPHAPITPSAFSHCALPPSLADPRLGGSCSRWAEAAARAGRHAGGARRSPLLDVHIAAALAVAGGPGALEAHLAAMEASGRATSVGGWSPDLPLSCVPFSVPPSGGGPASAVGEADAAWVYRAVAVPVARGLAALAADDPSGAVDALLPTRPLWPALGGSALQRSLLDESLVHAALRAPGQKHLRLGAALLSERVTLQQHSPGAWGMYAAALNALGDTRGAVDARNRAYVLGLRQGAQY